MTAVLLALGRHGALAGAPVAATVVCLVHDRAALGRGQRVHQLSVVPGRSYLVHLIHHVHADILRLVELASDARFIVGLSDRLGDSADFASFVHRLQVFVGYAVLHLNE